MSEYRRFFSYIYAYEQHQKTSNAGFAKIEMKGPMTTIELHMRNVTLGTPAACLYLFVRSDDGILGFPLGDVPFSGGNTDRRFTLNQPELGGSSYRISDVAGILLSADDHICFVSQWDEAPIDWESFRVYTPEPEKEAEPEPASTDPSPGEKVIQSAELAQPRRRPAIFEAVAASLSAELAGSASRGNAVPEDASGENAVPKDTSGGNAVPEDASWGNAVPEEASGENAVPEKASAENIQPAAHGSWKETWQQLISSLPLLHPFSNENINCVRVELKDLRLLPPSNWHLCNNSFLLHAFFTYRHLILGEISSAKGHRWFIGIPGIRYRQEHVLAAIFGFSEFLPDKGNMDEDAPFGYWVVPMTEAD